ncbi:MAG: Na(+)/H(+) antiporter subunit D [Deferrisomatales bacterium]
MSLELPPFAALWLGAAVLPLLPRPARAWAFLAFPALALALVWALPGDALLRVPFLGYELVPLEMDRLSRVFGTIFALVGILAGVYALHLRDLGQQVAALLYGGAALGVTFAGDYLSLFLFWEVMAVASVCLVWARRTPEAEAAGKRYLLVHLFGGSLLLAGICLQVAKTGTLRIGAFAPYESPAAWLILLGVALNTALPPLHAWLPDAYPKATVTGAVFLSAYTTKTSVYVLATLFPGWDLLIAWGVTMALYGVVYAVLANDIREILAYHIISQVGYMVAAVGIGTELALNGAAAHAFSHILYKALLFMGAGVALHTTGRSKLTELGGFAHRQRAVVWLYMIGAFSISGFPLFNGFISKSAIVAAAGQAHHTAAMLLLLLASIGTFLHTGLKLPYFTWYGEDRGIVPERAPANMVVAMAGAAFLCTLYGVAPQLLYRMLPFPMDYQPYTVPHLVETTQLLVFTFVAFWVLRKKLAGEAKVALDTDWFYRRPARWLDRWLVGTVNAFFTWWEAAALRAATGIAAVARNPNLIRGLWGEVPAYDPDRHRLPVGVSLALTLVALLVLAVWGLVRAGA